MEMVFSCARNAAFNLSPPRSPRSSAKAAEESSTMLLTSKLAARFFAAFIEEFVEDPFQAAALSDDGCTQLFERHPPTENANSVFFGKDGQPVARLEAIFFPDRSGENDSATFTKNY